MKDWKSLSHVRWDCKYHLAFITKYRHKSVHGEGMGMPLKELARGLLNRQTPHYSASFLTIMTRMSRPGRHLYSETALLKYCMKKRLALPSPFRSEERKG